MNQFLRHARHTVTENPITLVAFGLLVLFVLLAIFGPWMAPHDPLASNAARTLQPPSRAHPFGTDQIGRDIMSRVMVAARLDLAIAVSAVALSFALGSLAGNGPARVLFVHVFPNCLPPMIVQASLNLGWAILNAASLSFIGLGVRPPIPEWGIMVADGAAFMVSGEWWVAFFPGLALMLAVFCFNLLGDGVRDLLDPRQRT